MMIALPAPSNCSAPLLIETIVGALEVALHGAPERDVGLIILTAGSPTSLVIFAGAAMVCLPRMRTLIAIGLLAE